MASKTPQAMLVCFRKVQFMHVCLWLNHDHSDNYVIKLKFIGGLVVMLNVYRAMFKLYVKRTCSDCRNIFDLIVKEPFSLHKFTIETSRSINV